MEEDIANSQIQAARKEIKANIRRQLNTSQLRLRLDHGLADAMDTALKQEGHPINKLFALGRLDQSDMDHWRALTFLMAEEIFIPKVKGAPPKDDAPIKHAALLLYLNEIHRIRIEDGQPSSVADAVLDLPVFFERLAQDPKTASFAQRYQKMKISSLKDYVHAALTEGRELLQNEPEILSPGTLKMVEEALDNFRPGWRRSQP